MRSLPHHRCYGIRLFELSCIYRSQRTGYSTELPVPGPFKGLMYYSNRNMELVSGKVWSLAVMSSPTCFNEPWVTLTPVALPCTNFNNCIPGTPHKTCRFGDRLTPSFPSLFGPCQIHLPIFPASITWNSRTDCSLFSA